MDLALVSSDRARDYMGRGVLLLTVRDAVCCPYSAVVDTICVVRARSREVTCTGYGSRMGFTRCVNTTELLFLLLPLIMMNHAEH